MPLRVVGGGLRPSTVAMYRFMLKVMLPKLGDKRISEVTGIDIMQFLQYLRDEYRAPNGKKVSEKTINTDKNLKRKSDVTVKRASKSDSK